MSPFKGVDCTRVLVMMRIKSTLLLHCMVLAPVVQKMGRTITIQWISFRKTSCTIHWIEIYLVPVVQTLDSAIQWIVQSVFLILIRWIVIYPVDSTIQRLNNRGLMGSVIHPLNSWGQNDISCGNLLPYVCMSQNTYM